MSKKKNKAEVFGQAGGKATYKKYGSEHYAKLAKKMHEKKRRAARLKEEVA